MRTRLLATLLAAAVALGVSSSGAPASAAPAKAVRQTWYLAVTDTTDTAWAATYYKTYTVSIDADGRISGTGRYVGTSGTSPEATGVRCYDQTIAGRRKVGGTSTWRADYVNEPYWYSFSGSIAADGTHQGTGVNVNGHTFTIRSVSRAELDANRNCAA